MLYSSAMGANLDPKIALNYMMSKYQEELMRQYTQLGVGAHQSSLLNNPFAMNSLMPSLTKPSLSNVNTGSTSQMPSTSTSTATSTSSSSKQDPSKIKSSEKTKDPNIRYSKESNKAYYAEPTKSTKEMSMFKDRPGISITPIQNAPQPPQPSQPQQIQNIVPTSPTKTLQQKLAERQKQNPAAQHPKTQPPTAKSSSRHETAALDLFNQYQNFTQKNMPFAKPSVPLPPVPHGSKLNRMEANTSKIQASHSSTSHYKNMQKTIPSSLTITKAQPPGVLSQLETRDSGISISHIAPSAKMMNFRKPSVPKLKLGNRKLGSDITVTANFTKPPEGKKDMHASSSSSSSLPMSLSMKKKDEGSKKGNPVEIIEIE